MGVVRDVREVLVTEAKFLCFVPVRPDLDRVRVLYLAFVLLASWVAGIGRFWDAPDPLWWQYAGLSSIIATFSMAALLWIVVLPMEPANWSYMNVLTFVGMVAPPTFFYAIPMERIFDGWNAQQANYAVAVFIVEWRLGLLWFFLRGVARLNLSRALVALLSVVCLVLIVARVPVVLQFEGRGTELRAEHMLLQFGTLALLASPFLLIAYLRAVSSYESRQVAETVESGSSSTREDGRE